MKCRNPLLLAHLALGLSAIGIAQSPAGAPRIWDDAALADWTTPIAALNLRPAHLSAAEYYKVRGDNLRTYPIYHPDSEPAGYWDNLQNTKPEPLVDVAMLRTPGDWIAAGERAFRGADHFWSRTDDPAIIKQARDPASFRGVLKLADGTAFGPRWVVTDRGISVSYPACANCHFTFRADGSIVFAGPRGARPAGSPVLNPRIPGAIGSPPVTQRYFVGDDMHTITWRMFSVPWAADERIDSLRDAKDRPLQFLTAGDPGIFHRPHGSPFFATKIPDLHTLRYSRYLDATATHRLRGPEDVARYAQFINGADPMDFGSHRFLSDEQRRLRFRYADEVVYAMGAYLLSLEPAKNPERAPQEMLDRGAQIFRREGCLSCHVPPDYTSGKLTLAQGYQPPADHPYREDIVPVTVGTDPGLAMKTRKGTGFYKIPSLRGVWYRPRFFHDGSVASLEEMFDAARLKPDHVPGGWKGPGVTQRAVPGHAFGLSLNVEEKSALLAFLRSL